MNVTPLVQMLASAVVVSIYNTDDISSSIVFKVLRCAARDFDAQAVTGKVVAEACAAALA